MPTACPKCAHIRTASDPGPDHSCPACGVVYAKFDPAIHQRNEELYSRTRARNHAMATGDWSAVPKADIPPDVQSKLAARVLVTTTHSVPGREVQQVIEVVSAECVFGVNILRDMMAGITDITGGRNSGAQKVLQDAKATVMAQLRSDAYHLGAHAVIGMHLHYNEISGGGKSMLFVVATGTAVALS